MTTQTVVLNVTHQNVAVLARGMITASTAIPREAHLSIRMTGADAVALARKIEALQRLADSKDDALEAMQGAIDATDRLYVSSRRTLRGAVLVLFCGLVLAGLGLVAVWGAA